MMQALFLPILVPNRQSAEQSHAFIKMSITLGAKPTVPAVLSLIHALRAVKTKITLYHLTKMTARNSPRIRSAFVWRK